MNGIKKFVILFSFLSMAFLLNAQNYESKKISVGDSLFNSVQDYYTDGVNITIDDGYTEKVLTTMLEAASAGHSGACYFLGRYYWFSAWSNNENYKESFKWFLKGYESGSSDCTFWLGVLYDNGQGVGQDKKTATRLFIESARKGDTRAIPRLESLTKTYIANADLEDADIQLYLAIMSEYGFGVEQNRSKAVTYYRKSADLGNKIAQERLSAKDKEYNSYFENGKTDIGTSGANTSRWALKTNLLLWGILTPNLEVEYLISRKWSINIDGQFAWWSNSSKHDYYQIAAISPELRFWLCSKTPFSGHYIGFFSGTGLYDLEMGKTGYQSDNYLSVGLSYGYMKPLSRRLSLEFGIGAGYVSTQYRKYLPANGHYVYQTTNRRNYTGPVKVKIGLVWKFNNKSK